nr:retrovirus-related Pol polyprotein from transposon TNT 1-94 [Tanacetum cinerariifolium]
MIDYALWKVIENGATLPITKVVEGVMTEMPITIAKEKAHRRLEVKARSTLMMGIPNEHQLKFNSIKDDKKFLEAVEKRFGENAAKKKTHMNLLKQQYENFTTPSSEMLDQTFDRLQKLVSQLELLEEKFSQKDVNQKLLRSLSPEWNTHVVVWRNKADLDTMSMDDLYNNLKDLEQIHPYDMEEMDLRWQMTMLTMKARRFLKKTGRKLTVNGNQTISFDKSNVECYNCHKRGHFARECRALRNQDNKNKEISRRSMPVETSTLTALVSGDSLVGYDWSDQAEEGPNYALMAFLSSSSDSEFCEMKGNLRQFSVTITLKQNGVAERRNMTLVEAARTMLADSKLPTIFWAEAVNTACYVQNIVLVVKPHNKTPYELFHGRTPTLSFMRPFMYPDTILNTIDHLGKFDGKADEGFFVGYPFNSKAFGVFNNRTTIVEENLHIRFSESTPNVIGGGPDWLFDIDALTRTMNYEPIVAGTQSNGFAGTKASNNAGQARKETELVKDYILLQLWTADLLFSQDPKSSHDDGSKPSSDDGKKMSSMGELTFFLGLQVKQKEDYIFISQDKYVAEILKKFGFTKVKTASTPMETQKPLLKNDDGEEVDIHMYRSMIGSLMYLTSSRPDIMFALCACTRYQVNPKFWSNAMAKTINGEVQLHAQEVGKEIVITESSVRRDLQLADEEGIDYLPNSAIFEQLALMGFGKGFSGKVTHLFQTMVIQNQSELGEGSATPTDPHHIPTILQPSSSQTQKTQKTRKPARKDTQVPQPSGPTKSIADEAVHKELGDSLVRHVTTASSLRAEQVSDNITKTQSKATPNESSFQGTNSGGGPRVLDLEQTKTTQKNEISARVESYDNEESLSEDASKQERRIDVIDADKDIALVNDADKEMFEVDVLGGEEMFVARQNENVVEEVVDAAQVSTAATTIIITTKEITLAQALEALKTSKPKVKGIVFQEQGKSTTTTISSQQSQDKGKGIMIEEPVKPKKKDQIRLDEKAAKKLQAEFDKEERLAREKSEKEERANISLIETLDDIQAKIDANHQ